MNPHAQRRPATPSRRRCLVGVGATLAGCLATPSWGQQAPVGEDKAAPAPKIGMRLDTPDVPLLDGRVFRPSDADGQLLVV